jgi:hypothetical protein
MKRLLSVLLILVMVVVNFTACNAKLNKYSDYSFDYFDTVTTIVGYEKTEDEFKNKTTYSFDDESISDSNWLEDKDILDLGETILYLRS